jgi:hypothetical protein
VAAGKAHPKMHPLVSHFQAFFAAIGAGLYGFDLVHVSAIRRHHSLLEENLTLRLLVRPVN